MVVDAVKDECGNVTIVSNDGIDVSVSEDSSGGLVRIDAITGSPSGGGSVPSRHMMIEGDACISVDAYPNAIVDSSMDIVEDPTGANGVIRLSSSCGSCCQCDDYMDAVRLLQGIDGRIEAIRKDLARLDVGYCGTVDDFNDRLDGLKSKINSFDYIVHRITKTVGPVDDSRRRDYPNKYYTIGYFTGTLTILNMTLGQVGVGIVNTTRATGYGDVGGVVSESYSTPSASGSKPPTSLSLGPGESVSYACTMTRNRWDEHPVFRVRVRIVIEGGSGKTFEWSA